jgi:hypothetical protein
MFINNMKKLLVILFGDFLLCFQQMFTKLIDLLLLFLLFLHQQNYCYLNCEYD